MGVRAGLLAVLAAAAVPRGSTQTVSGELEGYYALSDRRLDDSRHYPGLAGTLQDDFRPSPTVRFFLETRLGIDRERDFRFDPRQAYLDVYARRIDLRIGNQVLKWGEADGFNPTDHLSPKDLIALDRDDDDARMGMPALKADCYGDIGQAELVLLPWFRGDRTPLSARLPETGRRRFPALDPGWGMKATARPLGWSLSLSYFRGRDPEPAYFLDARPRYIHPRLEAVGGDFSGVAGEYGLRGEWAYSMYKGDCPKSDALFSVVGIDRDFGRGIYGNLQLLDSYAPGKAGSAPPAEGMPSELAEEFRRRTAMANNRIRGNATGASWRIQYSVPDQAWTAAYSVLINLMDRDSWMRLSLKRSLGDHCSALMAGDWFRGADGTYLSQLRRNSNLRAIFRYAF